MKDQRTVTTRTDYVTKDVCTNIQPTNILIEDTDDQYGTHMGLIKASELIPKSPGQHYRDLTNVVYRDKVVGLRFLNADGTNKDVVCLRVDGGPDEGPHHVMVRYYHALHHIEFGSRVMLVTVRWAGGSYLNGVERLNGHQGYACNNVFISATLKGSNTPHTSQVCPEAVRANMTAAVEEYIRIVDGSPAMNGKLRLVAPPIPSPDELQREQTISGIMRAATDVKRDALLAKAPADIRDEVVMVRTVEENHWKKVYSNGDTMEVRYCYKLECCFKPGCPHPKCKLGRPAISPVWFDGGPTCDGPYHPYPAPDPERPGHYLSAEANLAKWQQGDLQQHVRSPQHVIDEAWKTRIDEGKENDEATYGTWTNNLAVRTMIPQSRVVLRIDHLKEIARNIRAGMEKGKKTRADKKAAAADAAAAAAAAAAGGGAGGGRGRGRGRGDGHGGGRGRGGDQGDGGAVGMADGTGCGDGSGGGPPAAPAGGGSAATEDGSGATAAEDAATAAAAGGRAGGGRGRGRGRGGRHGGGRGRGGDQGDGGALGMADGAGCGDGSGGGPSAAPAEGGSAAGDGPVTAAATKHAAAEAVAGGGGRGGRGQGREGGRGRGRGRGDGMGAGGEGSRLCAAAGDSSTSAGAGVADRFGPGNDVPRHLTLAVKKAKASVRNLEKAELEKAVEGKMIDGTVKSLSCAELATLITSRGSKAQGNKEALVAMATNLIAQGVQPSEKARTRAALLSAGEPNLEALHVVLETAKKAVATWTPGIGEGHGGGGHLAGAQRVDVGVGVGTTIPASAAPFANPGPAATTGIGLGVGGGGHAPGAQRVDAGDGASLSISVPALPAAAAAAAAPATGIGEGHEGGDHSAGAQRFDVGVGVDINLAVPATNVVAPAAAAAAATTRRVRFRFKVYDLGFKV